MGVGERGGENRESEKRLDQSWTQSNDEFLQKAVPWRPRPLILESFIAELKRCCTQQINSVRVLASVLTSHRTIECNKFFNSYRSQPNPPMIKTTTSKKTSTAVTLPELFGLPRMGSSMAIRNAAGMHLTAHPLATQTTMRAA
jgi:hypothetical protein